MQIICEECGAVINQAPSQIKRSEHHFCSQQCHMKNLNRKLNPKRMTFEVRQKIRIARLGTGTGKSYEKTFGRHTHRVIAEQKLGRKLRPGEIVHHIDGNKRNNDPSNLAVMTQSEHARLHFSKGGD